MTQAAYGFNRMYLNEIYDQCRFSAAICLKRQKKCILAIMTKRRVAR